MRPPSSGKAGIRLKRNSTALIVNSQPSSATPGRAVASLSVATSKKSPVCDSAAAPTRESPAIRNVTAGPATATLKSSPGVSASRSIFAIPPKNHRSMPEIPMPSRRAIIAWPSSCRTIEAKNRTAPATATA